MMTREDLRDAIEGARDHGKQEGPDGYTKNYRAPSVETIERWFVRVFREIEDQSITVHEMLELLDEQA